MEYSIRPIEKADNAQVAQVIRKVMTEFGCVGDGFSITDPEVDDMYGFYRADRHDFYVVEEVSEASKTIVLVGGYAPLINGDPEMSELRKMYGYSSIRGKGLGRKLMEQILEAATAAGFKQMYLETASSMNEAAGLYKRFGFTYIDTSLGHTGHGGCDRFMLKDL
ncbi:MAG: GNAT family N-acetyltransferase [Saprospiraceae bacterium]